MTNDLTTETPDRRLKAVADAYCKAEIDKMVEETIREKSLNDAKRMRELRQQVMPNNKDAA